MANPILQMLNPLPSSPQAAPQQPNNPLAMLQQFQQFRQSLAGRNPQELVQQLVQSGRMTPQQLQQLERQAQGILSMFRR